MLRERERKKGEREMESKKEERIFLFNEYVSK